MYWKSENKAKVNIQMTTPKSKELKMGSCFLGYLQVELFVLFLDFFTFTFQM